MACDKRLMSERRVRPGRNPARNCARRLRRLAWQSAPRPVRSRQTRRRGPVEVLRPRLAIPGRATVNPPAGPPAAPPSGANVVWTAFNPRSTTREAVPGKPWPSTTWLSPSPRRFVPSASLPGLRAEQYDHQWLANRHDYDVAGVSPMYMPRMNKLTTELGGTVSFTCGQSHACPTPPSSNIRLPCNFFPAYDAYTGGGGWVRWNNLEARASEGPGGEIQAHLDFESCRRVLGGAAATAGPHLGQSIWQGDGRTVLEIDAIKPLQEGDGDWIGGDGLWDGGIQHPLQTAGGLRRETVVEALGADLHSGTATKLVKERFGQVGVLALDCGAGAPQRSLEGAAFRVNAQHGAHAVG